MSVRRLMLLSGVAVLGIAGAVAIPVLSFAAMKRAEDSAAAALTDVYEAQRAFRGRGGGGGYATALDSLTTPCAGVAAPVLSHRLPSSYVFDVRVARDGRHLGFDCHGRPTASDFYASARPADPFAGRLALAVTARGRVYAFFDGVPPLERDMAGGLAVPLETVPDFKIP